MAEIHVERKRGIAAWAWVLVLVVLIVAAALYLWQAGYLGAWDHGSMGAWVGRLALVAGGAHGA
ncbi:MAG: hypothetical protein ACT4O1_03450 [Gemmatimonadota bacterium]